MLGPRHAILLCLATAAALAACQSVGPLHLLSTTSAAAPPASMATHRAALRELHVTTGRVVELAGGRLHVTDPKTRFVASGAHQSVEVHFAYRGPTARTTALASGETRRQLGIKLRAQDGCNVVYAMWRIEPESKLVVSVKRNAGKSTQDECGAGGYGNIKPARSAAIPTLLPNESHVLAARIDGDRLRVTIDAREVWEGMLPREAFAFDGPVGLRTDNVDVDLDFFAGE